MIFGTVGTQLPFDRLVKAVDREAATLSELVFVQCGPSDYKPRHIETRDAMSPAQFDAQFAKARLIVAHAGIGTILSAIKYRKPLVILPRRHALGEHRNDHQVATAKRLETLRGLYIAWTTEELGPLLRRVELDPLSDDERHPPKAALIDYLRTTISSRNVART